MNCRVGRVQKFQVSKSVIYVRQSSHLSSGHGGEQGVKRRSLLKGAAITGTAVAAGSMPAPAIAQGGKEWKMALTLPGSTPGLGLSAQRVAQRIALFTDGAIKIKVYTAGELVASDKVFDAVSSGDVEMYQGPESNWQDRHKAFNFFTNLPFGLTGNEFYAWINHGGGQELWDELSAEFNLKGFASHWTGVQMGGWYLKEINSLKDLQGLKVRMPGVGGDVLSQFGAEVVNLPDADIYPALQSGALDGAEWVGPWSDLAFGFHKIAKYYYAAGFHEPGSVWSFGINRDLWDSLTETEREIICTAIQAEGQYQTSEFLARDAEALEKLKTDHEIQIRSFTDAMYQEFGRASGDIVRKLAAEDALSQKIFNSYSDFRNKAIALSQVQQSKYLRVRELPFQWS